MMTTLCPHNPALIWILPVSNLPHLVLKTAEMLCTLPLQYWKFPKLIANALHRSPNHDMLPWRRNRELAKVNPALGNTQTATVTNVLTQIISLTEIGMVGNYWQHTCLHCSPRCATTPERRDSLLLLQDTTNLGTPKNIFTNAIPKKSYPSPR